VRGREEGKGDTPSQQHFEHTNLRGILDAKGAEPVQLLECLRSSELERYPGARRERVLMLYAQSVPLSSLENKDVCVPHT
jgi:hypothetical protein